MAETLTRGPIRVLVVDDEPHHRRCLSLGLKLEGFVVVEAPDANVALRLLAREVFDAAVVDVMMPGVNGLELARRVRTEHPEMRVLLMSAYHLTEQQIARANVGVVGFLPKPYRLEDVAHVLRFATVPAAAGASDAA